MSATHADFCGIEWAEGEPGYELLARFDLDADHNIIGIRNEAGFDAINAACCPLDTLTGAAACLGGSYSVVTTPHTEADCPYAETAWLPMVTT